MGSVSIDLYKQERQYKDLTLSSENVVKYLILYRSKVDTTYGVSVNTNIYQAGDVFEFNQELVALYASLDTLIENCQMKEKEKQFLTLLFTGNSLSDIVRDHDYYYIETYRMLDKIIFQIIQENNKNWKSVMGKKKGIV